MWLLCGFWGVPLGWTSAFLLPFPARISRKLTGKGVTGVLRTRGERAGLQSGHDSKPALFLPTSALVWTRLEVPEKSGTHVLAAAVLQGELRLAAERPVFSWGGLTSLIVPRVQLLDPQLIQGLGELQLLPGHVVPEQHHVLGADVTLRTDDRENVLQRHLRADAHNGLLRPQVVHYQTHGLLGEHTGHRECYECTFVTCFSCCLHWSGLRRFHKSSGHGGEGHADY